MTNERDDYWTEHRFMLPEVGSVALGYSKKHELFYTQFSRTWIEDGQHAQAQPISIITRVEGDQIETTFLMTPETATALRYLLNTSTHVPEHASVWRQILDLIMSTPFVKYTTWLYSKEFQKYLKLSELGL